MLSPRGQHCTGTWSPQGNFTKLWPSARNTFTVVLNVICRVYPSRVCGDHMIRANQICWKEWRGIHSRGDGLLCQSDKSGRTRASCKFERRRVTRWKREWLVMDVRFIHKWIWHQNQGRNYFCASFFNVPCLFSYICQPFKKWHTFIQIWSKQNEEKSSFLWLLFVRFQDVDTIESWFSKSFVANLT